MSTFLVLLISFGFLPLCVGCVGFIVEVRKLRARRRASVINEASNQQRHDDGQAREAECHGRPQVELLPL